MQKNPKNLLGSMIKLSKVTGYKGNVQKQFYFILFLKTRNKEMQINLKMNQIPGNIKTLQELPTEKSQNVIEINERKPQF